MFEIIFFLLLFTLHRMYVPKQCTKFCICSNILGLMMTIRIFAIKIANYFDFGFEFSLTKITLTKLSFIL